MTEGGSWFEVLASHNIDQARARIEQWQFGRQIRGKNERQTFAIDWRDVDYIAIVSVVDGRHAACVRHELEVLKLPPKVTLVATLTSGAMRELAQLGGGARELVNLCTSLPFDEVLSEYQVRQLVKHRHDHLLSASVQNLKIPNRLGNALIGTRELNQFDESRFKLEAMRRGEDVGAGAFSDLDWEDVFEASAFICNQTAELEWLEMGSIQARIFGSTTRFMVIVSTNSEALNQRFEMIAKMADENGCSFIYTIMLTAIGPIEMFAMLSEPKVTGLAKVLGSLT